MMTTSQFAGLSDNPRIAVVRDSKDKTWPVTVGVTTDGGKVTLYMSDEAAADLYERMGAALATRPQEVAGATGATP